MTVLSRGARVRRGGRRPGWVLLTALLVLAIGASSALVFTNRVELLKLAVILALWAAVAGAFVSVLYRRQSDADKSRVRDLKLVYDLQLDREISARREYELTVESQLRRELASELRAQAADDLAELRAELSALRTSLEILFDTDLQQRPALENPETEAPPERAYSEWERNGETPRDWVSSDRITAVPRESPPVRPDETAIIDVPEEPLLPPRQPPPRRERVRYQYEAPQEPVRPAQPEPSYSAPPEPEPRFEPRQQPPPPPAPEPEPEGQAQGWQAVGAAGLWLPPGTPGTHWAGPEAASPPAEETSGRRRRARHSELDETFSSALVEPPSPPSYAESSRRARSRHSAEHGDYGARSFAPPNEPPNESTFAPPAPAAATPPPPPPPSPHPAAAPPPPRLAPPPPLDNQPRHGGGDAEVDDLESRGDGSQTGGQSVADLLARLQVQPSEGGRRRRRDG